MWRLELRVIDLTNAPPRPTMDVCMYVRVCIRALFIVHFDTSQKPLTYNYLYVTDQNKYVTGQQIHAQSPIFSPPSSANIFLRQGD